MTMLMLKNVRLSFPNVFKKSNYQGKEGKYDATFLISKSDKKQVDLVKNTIKTLVSNAKIKVDPAFICLKDGDSKEYEGYKDHYTLKASNNRKPKVYDREKNILTEEDDIIYAGCYVNALIEFWVQNNGFGKRVNANLHGLQFVKEGDSFVKTVDVDSEFNIVEVDGNKAESIVESEAGADDFFN